MSRYNADFLRNKLSILLIPLYDEKWASSRYRLYNYVPRLEDCGIECKIIDPPQRDLVSRLIYLLKILYHSRNFEILYIQKKVFKKPFMFLLHRINSKIVFDFDDAIFAKPTTMYQRNFDLDRTRKSLNYVLRKSKKIIVGNQFLRDYTIRINCDVHIIPTPVRRNPLEHPPSKQNDKVIVGWIGNKENLIYLKELGNVFRQLYLKFKDRFVLKVICDEPLILKGIKIVNKQWSLEKEFQELADIDIGIMPLKEDDWSQGKCAFKILQFMSMGIPVVASPIGMNKEVIKNGVNGYLPKTEEDWISQISNLISDRKIRTDFAHFGIQVVDSTYTYDATTPLLIEVFKECQRG
jgi:glycosyltransferase involved in cell wall biosynthesis